MTSVPTDFSRFWDGENENSCVRDVIFQIRSLKLFVDAEEVILSNERFLSSPEKRNRTLSS